MTDVECQRIWTCIAAAYPSAVARMTDQQVRDTGAVYRRMLGDLDYPAANAAVERLIATSKFLPSIAEVREAALSVSTGDRRAGGEAWGDIMRGFQRWGVDAVCRWDDPLVGRAVAALGWRDLCNSENPTADRARFIELYDQLAATTRRDAVAGNLPAARALREQRLGEGQPAGGLMARVFAHLDANIDEGGAA